MHICGGGETYKIMKGDKGWWFEDHVFCGPMPVDKKTLQGIRLPNDSPFWTIVTWWYQQGKKTTQANGFLFCKWDKPKPIKVRHLAGIHYVTDDFS